MFIFVLPTKKRWLVSFWTCFQISRQPQRIRHGRNYQKILLVQGFLSKVKLDNPLFCFNLINRRLNDLLWQPARKFKYQAKKSTFGFKDFINLGWQQFSNERLKSRENVSWKNWFLNYSNIILNFNLSNSFIFNRLWV